MNKPLDDQNLTRQRSDLDRIDQLCEQFEGAWKAGLHPPTEEYLGQVPEQDRSALFEQLLRVELHWRRGRGEQPTQKEYLARFPQFTREIELALKGEAMIPVDLLEGVTEEQFVESLVQSGLMSAGEVWSFRQSLPPEGYPDSAHQLASELIRQGKLTPYQAATIDRGRLQDLVFGEYTVLDEIGAGGMGRVFKARHRTMERGVAIKVLSSRTMDSPEAIKRFHQEVKAAAKLMHPNIVTAHDASEHHGIHYLVMEHVEGSDLAKVVKGQGPLPVARALDYVTQAARGLEYAHERGIIHRDIKPANLLVDPGGTLKLSDMGLARISRPREPNATASLDQVTSGEQMMGTCAFMAPEQATDAHGVDGRADVYSLGCTLYFLLTGRSPYRGETVMETLLAHREAEIPSLGEARPEVPPELDGVFRKMLAKKPEERQQTMGAVVADLEACAARLEEPAGEAQAAAPQAAAPQSDVAEAQPRPDAEATDTASQEWRQATRPIISPAERPVEPRAGRKKPPIAALVGLAALLVAVAFGVVFTLKTSEGTVIVEVDQPGAEVSIDDGKITITTPDDGQPVHVRVEKGTHTLTVTKGGFQTRVEKFTIASRGREAVRVELVPRKSSPPAERVNHALEFDGRSACVKLPLRLPVVEQLTLEAWVVPYSQISSRSCSILSNADSSGVSLELGYPDERTWHFTVHDASGYRKAASDQPPVIGKRTHLAGVFDGKRVRLFVDGQIVPTEAEMESPPKTSLLPLAIGANPEESDPFKADYFFRGVIDEVRVSFCARYDKRFTPQERLEPDEHTLALYHFDEGSGNVLQDSSGNGHHGEIVGAKWGKVEDLAAEADAERPPLAVAPFTPEQAKQHQQQWADHLGVPVQFENSIGMKMVLIPPGEFMMGSTEEEVAKTLEEGKEQAWARELAGDLSSESSQHPIRISKPFFLSVHEVTVGHFGEFVEATGYETEAETDSRGGTGFVEDAGESRFEQRPYFNWRNPGFEQTDQHPVNTVSWNDTTTFCNWLSKKEGRAYRLPTEAEWEFSCRSGSRTRWYFGEDEAKLGEYAWYLGETSMPVGQKLSNGFGVFDMYGNVGEWCSDWNGEYSPSLADDPVGPSSGTHRVLRGGAFNHYPVLVRSAFRYCSNPSCGFVNVGFRPILVLDELPSQPETGASSDRGVSIRLRAVLDQYSKHIDCVVFSPDGRFMASSGGDSKIRLWDTETFEESKVLTGHQHFVTEVAFSQDGNMLASVSVDGTMMIWDVQEGIVRHAHRVSSEWTPALALSADGRTLATTGRDKMIRLWEADTCREMNAFKAMPDALAGGLGALDFAPDGLTLAAAGTLSEITLWDPAEARVVRRLQKHTDRVEDVAFSPDGNRLASVGRDGSVRLWDLHGDNAEMKLTYVDTWLWCVAFSPDGRLLAFGGEDKLVHVWDIDKKLEVAQLEGHTGDFVSSTAFSPDGRVLASADMDGTIRLWDVWETPQSDVRVME